MRVVDASVVLRWLLEEPNGPASAILEAHVAGRELLAAPELLNYEVANVLVTKVNLPHGESSRLFEYFLDLEIQTYSLGPDEYRRSLDLAHQCGLTVYDSAYLALSQALEAELLTSDRKLAGRAQNLGIVRLV